MHPTDGDTLSSTEIAFSWNRTHEFNEEVDMSYEFWISSQADSASFHVEDTTFIIGLDTLEIAGSENTDFIWWVKAQSRDMERECNQQFRFVNLPSGSAYEENTLPVKFGIISVYPNPFNSTINIKFGLDNHSVTCIKLYDISGRMVSDILKRDLKSGYHVLSWEMNELPSGIYFLDLYSKSRHSIRRTVLLK